MKKLQDRIEEIKRADRKPYHEMAYEVGLSEYSLYKFMTQSIFSAHTENLIRTYVNGYKTKDEQIQELYKENDALKMYIKKLESKLYR